MKPETKKQITLKDIFSALDNSSLADARQQLAPFTGSQLALSGIVLKRSRRETVKFIIKIDSGSSLRQMTAILRFGESEKAKIDKAKIRKNSQIAIIGEFVSFGTYTICLNNCRLCG